MDRRSLRPPLIAAGAAALLLAVIVAGVRWGVPAEQLTGVLALLITVVGGAYKFAAGGASGSNGLGGADGFAEAVRLQWTAEATQRNLLHPAPLPVRWRLSPLLTPAQVAVTVAAQDGVRTFPTLPGVPELTDTSVLVSGGRAELHRVFGGLSSGRLVLAGGPGAGKTGAAVLLLLDALAHRQGLDDADRAKVPVPVIVDAGGWDPATVDFHAWLAERVSRSYQIRHKHAWKLVQQGSVAAIVDGLDEMSESLRPSALEAMSSSRTRLVLLSRTAELTQASRRHRLVDALVLEIVDIDPATGADYLERALPGHGPQHWDDLLRALRTDTDSNLARALGSPLMLTLLRDTYRADDDAGELLALAGGVETVQDHLLDRVVLAAYRPRAGRPLPDYDAQTALDALSALAARMSAAGTRDLVWWQVHRWTARRPRQAVTGLLTVVTMGSLSALVVGPAFGAVLGAAYGVVGAAIGGGGREPRRLGRAAWRRLLAGTAVGAAFFWSTLWLQRDDPLMPSPLSTVWIVPSLTIGLILGLLALAYGREEPPGFVTPMSSWRSDQRAGAVGGVVVATFYSLLLRGTAPVTALLSGATVGLLAAALAPATCAAALTFVQLARTDPVPLRLMRFLDDARRRGVLRAVGPVFQFRHARLQDRLAAMHDPAVATDSTSAPA